MLRTIPEVMNPISFEGVAPPPSSPPKEALGTIPWNHVSSSTPPPKTTLTRAGMALIAEQFALEVGRLVNEIAMAIPVLDTSRQWALGSMYRRFSAIRAASGMLGQQNVATVAARGEVLVCLLSQDLLEYQPIHGEILEDTLHLLRGIVARVERDGSDSLCYSTARTCLCLYAAAVPQTQHYQPA
jgi:hypothetical protein